MLIFIVPKVIDFQRYNMKCSGENEILRGTFHVVSRFLLHLMLYRGNFDYFLNSVETQKFCKQKFCNMIDYLRLHFSKASRG